jgi:succinate-acetate transporter protein
MSNKIVNFFKENKSDIITLGVGLVSIAAGLALFANGNHLAGYSVGGFGGFIIPYSGFNILDNVFNKRKNKGFKNQL